MNKAEIKDLPAPEYRYYINWRWVDRDELLAVSGVDAETDRLIAARARK